MNKYLLLFFLFTSCNFISTNETLEDYIPPTDENPKGKLSNINNVCRYDSSTSIKNIEIYAPPRRELEEINRIVSYAGLPQNFEIYTSDIENAYAIIIKGKRLIIFNKDLLRTVDRNSNTYWSSISILAHEIAHHFSGHTLQKSVNNIGNELEADKFSGYILYKLGAPKQQATVAIDLLGSETESITHPSKLKRKKAIEVGWEEAAKQRYESAIPPPPEELDDYSFEYTKEELWTEDDLKAREYYTEYDFFEGIITDIKKEGDLSEVQVYIDKVGLHNDYGVDVSKGRKVWISIGEPYSGKKISQVKASWIEEIMVPGRRIIFAFISEGSGGYHWFSFIKPVPPN